MDGTDAIPSFVMKTFQMVSDRATDTLICWGRASNSFIVSDPLEFSQRILPIYFKHNKFSSFVRQLNTSGFRKVDPDRWEFANECFLRGQVHLLKNIARRRHSRTSSNGLSQNRIEMEEDEDQEIMIEISKMKEEQRSFELEIQEMNKRLEATERRPHQMIAFLHKAVEDPELIPRIMLEKDRYNQFPSPGKKRRFLVNATSSSSSSSMTTTIKTDEEDEANLTLASSPDTVWCQSPETSSSAWLNNPLGSIHPSARAGSYGGGLGFEAAAHDGYMSRLDNVSRVGGFGYFQDVNEEANPVAPYPFSLFRGGF